MTKCYFLGQIDLDPNQNYPISLFGNYYIQYQVIAYCLLLFFLALGQQENRQSGGPLFITSTSLQSTGGSLPQEQEGWLV